MNKFKLNFKIYKYESYWRSSHNKKEYDSFNNILPFPIHSDNEWQNKQLFLEKLIDTNNELLSKHKFNTYDIPKNCLLCDEKNITTGLFKLNLICWEDGLIHYIKKHNTKPSDEFIDYIFRYQIGNRKIIARSKSKKIKGKTIIKENKRYLKINRNQILIMDSLMKQGSVKQFKDNDGMYRYSEQAGLLDFDSNGLERIIISAKTDKIDKYDNEIFLPSEMPDMFDFEYIFHTHPGSPNPGGRVKLGFLYEMPSVSDMIHFIYHYNLGQTQGSIVITYEGLYIIRKNITDNKIIKINENKFIRDITDLIYNINKLAIKKYGYNFTSKIFFEKIAQDKIYINKLNNLLNKYELNIDYYPRIYDKGKWIIDSVYIPIYVIE